MWVLYNRIFVLIIAFILDIIFGDPIWLYHPVRIMGKCINILEKYTRKIFKPKLAGFAMVISMVCVWFLMPALILGICYRVNNILGIVIESFICYQMIAAKDLWVESKRVYDAVNTGSLEKSQEMVGRIVGRDTNRLDMQGVIRATVETVAENTSDGVIAPLFYISIGGGPLGMCYKAINTMDSMVGYTNEKYIDFGYAAAKLDDIANYIPARISAIIMILASGLIGLDMKNAIKIYKRDRYNHKSPNSAHTEAVCAGALNVRLAGDAWYFGKLHKKDYIGDKNREEENQDIIRALYLMMATTVIYIIIAVAILFIGGMWYAL